MESSDESLPPDQESQYHVLSKPQKWRLIVLLSLAGALLPLSATVYFPVIQTISDDLDVNSTLVALTITTYMAVQAVAPVLADALSNLVGRRLSLVLGLLVFVAANAGLALKGSYALLLGLRCLQAAGSAATMSIGISVIADVVCPEERSGFLRTNEVIQLLGQAAGPVIGGVLNNIWGFRSTFWFLFALGIVFLVASLVAVPETHRDRAGNGCIPLHGLEKPLSYVLDPPRVWARNYHLTEDRTTQDVMTSFKRALEPVTFVGHKDLANLLAWGAVAYTAWSMVTATTTTVLLRGYPFLRDWYLGLCFLPNGIGCIVGWSCASWLLDRSLKLAEDRYKAEHRLAPEVKVAHRRDFPLVHTRLHLVPYFYTALIVALVLYGPSFQFNDLHPEHRPNLVAPLALQFFLAFSAAAIFNIHSLMLSDSFLDGSINGMTLNNLCRCLAAAGGVSAIQPLIDTLGTMEAFLIVTAAVLVCTPLIWVQWKWGEGWRQERLDARELAEQEREPWEVMEVSSELESSMTLSH